MTHYIDTKENAKKIALRKVKIIYFLKPLDYFKYLEKGLQRQRLIGSSVAGFNNAKTITKASATDLQARQDDYNKGI